MAANLLSVATAGARAGLAVLALVAALAACSPPPATVSGDAPAAAGDARAESAGTVAMARRLEELAGRADLLRNPYLNGRRVEHFTAIEPPADPTQRRHFELALATEYLRAGRTAAAIARFKELLVRTDAASGGPGSAFGHRVQRRLALAYLRLGEQANCLRSHHSESCILPIRGAGVHRDQEGSRAAIREFSAILERHPDDLRSRWLLNVASMTVGEYPDAVPAEWLIPPSAFASEYDLGRFEEIAAEVGLDVVGLAGAALMEDFDGDGYLDVLVTSWGLGDPMGLFRNQRDGTFSERIAEAGLTGMTGGLNAVHADYDNDGDMDVYVPRGAWFGEAGRLPPSLLRNRGDGWFDDVTEAAGLLAFRPSQAAAWGDYDNDGWVDLLVAGETLSRAAPYPTALYHNNRDGTFTDVAAEVGVDVVGFFKGAVWGDYDNDGRLDLYLTARHDRPANRLFHNDGPDAEGRSRFTDVADRAGVRGPAFSFPTWFFDYDNDGWLDLFVSSFGGSVEDVAADYLDLAPPRAGTAPRLYHNHRDGTFRDVTEQVGLDRVLLTMGSNFGDLDNDGWLDLYLGTGLPDLGAVVPNRAFRNAGGEYFQDLTTSGGFGHLQKGHGVAFGDLDNDGDQDVFVKVGGAFSGDFYPSALFENPGHGNRWITLLPVGVESNRAGIGARIRVTVEVPGGTREIYRTVTSGSSFGGSSLRQEIGLGGATGIRRIEVTWPASGTRQVFEDVALNRVYEVSEDEPALRAIRLERIALGGRNRAPARRPPRIRRVAADPSVPDA